MRLILLLFLTFCLSAFGQNERSHTCRILFLDAPETAPRELFLFDGKVSQSVKLPRANFSPVYELASGDLTLALTTEPVESSEEMDPRSPLVKVPAQVGDFYLLVSSDSKNPVAPVRMQVVEINENEFKKGEMLWFNLTPTAVGGRLGSETLQMRPQSKAIVKAPAKDSDTYHVKLFYQNRGDKNIYPITETVWNFDPRSRMIVFVTSGEDVRTPRVRAFPDFRLKPKEEE